MPGNMSIDRAIDLTLKTRRALIRPGGVTSTELSRILGFNSESGHCAAKKWIDSFSLRYPVVEMGERKRAVVYRLIR